MLNREVSVCARDCVDELQDSPMYSGLFITMFAFLLRAYSPLNLLLSVVIIGIFMLKSVIEERFLRENPEYAAYMARVRHRRIPGVA